MLKDQPLPRGVEVIAQPAGVAIDGDKELAVAPLGPTLPGWRLVMASTGGDVFDQAASERRGLLLTIATVLVGVTLAGAWFVASGVRRQMQVARLKNDLVATVSHELKTPLASIRLLVDTLLDGDGAGHGAEGIGGKTREYLELISHENARLSRLIDNFLTFSRMERGKHRFEFEPVDLREVIERATTAVADRFDGKSATLEATVEGPLWVRGDIEALVTAVINLIDNAWKYSGERKLVEIRGRRAGDSVVIEVRDNGVGLSPRAARKVFERFYQVDQQLSRAQGGCGLGLSIVKYIVEAHGGSAAVESRLGEGSMFTLKLPEEKTGEAHESAIGWSLTRPVRSG
jgi:signal transduction histidine kinase